ncbi:MAG: single-stranded DNA-binding protein [Elusimicrobia bacterium]|nr:single-stranded DNA-binding protein [Elusimicrobiota bacterium]
MGNLNKVMLIGRLTRDPEVKEFSNGGKVAQLGFAVNQRRRNNDGEWEDAPVWMDLKAFNHEHGRKLADLAAAHLHRGQQLYVEGHLAVEHWDGKEDGKKHSKTLIYVDALEFLGGGKRPETGGPQAAGGKTTAPKNRTAARHEGGEHG